MILVNQNQQPVAIESCPLQSPCFREPLATGFSLPACLDLPLHV